VPVAVVAEGNIVARFGQETSPVNQKPSLVNFGMKNEIVMRREVRWRVALSSLQEILARLRYPVVYLMCLICLPY
jgi:hypothetical protein